MSWPLAKGELAKMRAEMDRLIRGHDEYNRANQILVAENDALRQDNIWRKYQMDQNWPRNEYGSLLTRGEYDAIRAQVRKLRDTLEDWHTADDYCKKHDCGACRVLAETAPKGTT